MADRCYQISPESSLELLSINEMKWLMEKSKNEQHELLRRCVLAVLNSGAEQDNAKDVLEQYHDFDVKVGWLGRGIRFELINPPVDAFVDGEMIRGIRELISAVVRDLVYSQSLLDDWGDQCLIDSKQITDYVFRILRNAKAVIPGEKPNLVVCWGGHSITKEEYHYSKRVGYELGLRGLNICTGCGPGAMKGPMKGATISHAKQRISDALYLGVTEPGIIASEAPNPIVNQLVILPDIEKRLEAFVRLAHGIIIFPGGAGTAEELLFILGVLSHPDNEQLPLSIVLTGPPNSEKYFKNLNKFIFDTLGKKATDKYQIIIDNPQLVAQEMKRGIARVTEYRLDQHEAFHFNWRLKITLDWQTPFEPTHASMAALNLSVNQPTHKLALQLRKAFSGIVAGNVKPDGIERIEKNGPFIMKGGKEVMKPLDTLLCEFVAEKRMMLPTRQYRPCYKIV